MGEFIRKQKGFTLVEILIVVIILAIMAAVIIPQFSSSTEEARLSTLKTNLRGMRAAIELYYHSHNNTYPGTVTSNYDDSAVNADYFADQLTLYTDKAGEAVTVKDATHKYGPYLKKGIPINPFNDLNTVKVNKAINNLTQAQADTGSGWKFYALTGQLFANDGAHGNY